MLATGRDAFARRAWGAAFEALSAADAEAPLQPDDLDRLAVAAYLTGRDAASADAWTRAYSQFTDAGESAAAARCAFFLGMSLFRSGEHARGSGWFAKARRLLDEAGDDCAERGYLLLPVALQHAGSGDGAAAFETFSQVGEIADRFKDSDLAALSRLGCGRALIMLGRTADGLALLDEVMVGVVAGEVTPIHAGVIYCAVIAICHELFDSRRAHEWTAALEQWCASQPDLVPYRGQCLVHRAQILALHGDWPDAVEETERACDWLAAPPAQPAAGAAFYELAELHRLRGESSAADAAFRRASDFGHLPQPGLALLRQAQGRADTAAAAIRVALDEMRDRTRRARLLVGSVEIMLAAGDAAAAAAAADELADIARAIDVPMLRAHSAYARGAVLVAAGDARAALPALRDACSTWQELRAPYQAAQSQVLIAAACRRLGDLDGWERELDAARATFTLLGAAPALARVAELAADAAGAERQGAGAGGLTGREMQVLGLLATGMTNRDIAAELVISEKTVARHVSNIFAKLRVSSRSGATAYAYEHRLV